MQSVSLALEKDVNMLPCFSRTTLCQVKWNAVRGMFEKCDPGLLHSSCVCGSSRDVTLEQWRQGLVMVWKRTNIPFLSVKNCKQRFCVPISMEDCFFCNKFIFSTNIFILNDKLLFCASRTNFVIVWGTLRIFPASAFFLPGYYCQWISDTQSSKKKREKQARPGYPARHPSRTGCFHQKKRSCTVVRGEEYPGHLQCPPGGRVLLPRPCSELRAQSVSVSTEKKAPSAGIQASELSKCFT